MATLFQKALHPHKGDMTSLVLNTKLDARQRDYAETIRAASDHLMTVINDILDFSKIEAGKLELELHAFSVRSCVEEALDLVALRASQQHIELAYVVHEETPVALLGDLGRTRQVLLNLLSNAVKFTEKGEVVVTVTSQPAKDSRHEVHFAVRDTGIGIPQGRASRLFDAFSQVDASTTRLYGGTGLGLAISKLLAELMGGKIWVESKLGKGSTFHFTIVAEETEAPEEHLIIAGADLRGKRVLVVDDNATNRRVAAGYVRRWGMTPVEAATPARALTIVEQHGAGHFDLCLIDDVMPEMRGAELAARIRRIDRRVPLVLLGSIGASRVRHGAFGAVLTKPIKPSHLFDSIMQALDGVRTPARTRKGGPLLDAGMSARHPLRILVAEDNAVNQKVAGAVLAKLGYKPDFASTGVEALDAVSRGHYDVVLMDVQMPEMDGLTATRQIQSRWPGRRPRIVAMTASATAEDRRRCLDAGMDDYLSKPVTPAKLMDALARCAPTRQHGVLRPEGHGARRRGVLKAGCGSGPWRAEQAFLRDVHCGSRTTKTQCKGREYERDHENQAPLGGGRDFCGGNGRADGNRNIVDQHGARVARTLAAEAEAEELLVG
jgi:CheY-like chemotaxis protein